jgi:hypothetical protein
LDVVCRRLCRNEERKGEQRRSGQPHATFPPSDLPDQKLTIGKKDFWGILVLGFKVFFLMLNELHSLVPGTRYVGWIKKMPENGGFSSRIHDHP